jgi:hypothetical protein
LNSCNGVTIALCCATVSLCVCQRERERERERESGAHVQHTAPHSRLLASPHEICSACALIRVCVYVCVRIYCLRASNARNSCVNVWSGMCECGGWWYWILCVCECVRVCVCVCVCVTINVLVPFLHTVDICKTCACCKCLQSHWLSIWC